MSESGGHHVLIVGAGFGGLAVAQGLSGAPVRITVVDQRNHHLFQPLLYQVGTATLATSEIAWPIRQLLRKRKESRRCSERSSESTPDRRTVQLEDGAELAYDTLVLATGARHAYFGHDEWEPYAPGLKTLEDATSIRRRILLAFEHAEREPDEARRRAWLTFVIVGGGATGVELAGAIAELAHVTLPDEFRSIDTRRSRILLIEAGPRILPTFTPDLSAYAHAALERLGVEIHTGSPVSECSAQGVVFGGRAACGESHPLGGRRARITRGSLARHGRRQCRAAQSGERPQRPRSSGDLRHRRHRDPRRLARQAASGHRARGQAAGRARRRHDQAPPRGR